MFYPKLLVGNFLKKIGWDLRPSWKFPICSIELAGIGLALIRAKKEGEPIHVIQVGAFDGTTSDPLCAFLGADDIRAFLLEPQSVPFEKMSGIESTRVLAEMGYQFIDSKFDRTAFHRDILK
jgi:hypothetical protein